MLRANLSIALNDAAMRLLHGNVLRKPLGHESKHKIQFESLNCIKNVLTMYRVFNLLEKAWLSILKDWGWNLLLQLRLYKANILLSSFMIGITCPMLYNGHAFDENC